MDQIVIRSLKSKYIVTLLTHIIQEVEGKDRTASDVKIDLLMVMNWIKFAWDAVTETTIRKCFAKACFMRENKEQDVIIEENDEEVAELFAT
jgi:hypothetical protein